MITSSDERIVIVGAGISGLVCARHFRQQDVLFLLLETQAGSSLR